MEKQNYRKIEYGKEETFRLNEHKFITHELKNLKNVYVSNNCNIKPRGLHIILKNVNNAIKEFKIIDNTHKIIISSYKDGMKSFGSYNAYTNEVYFNEAICDANKLAVENIEIGHVERHEIWHLKQAENYKKRFNLGSIGNYNDYIIYTRIRAKKFLDSLGINVDNVGDISDYASDMFDYKNYDEVEAEIKAKEGALCTVQNFQKKSKI